MKGHSLCRPPSGMHNVMRLGEDGRWRKDNKLPGRAFVGLAKPDTGDPMLDDVIVWIARCSCKTYLGCPVSRGMIYAADKYGGSATVHRRIPVAPKHAKKKSKR